MNNLKKIRQSKGLSQRDIAKNISFSQSQIAKWENGISQPSQQALLELADFYKCSIDYLVGRESEDYITSYNEESMLTAEEIEILDIYRNLNINGKQIAKSYLNSLIDYEEMQKKAK